VVLGEVKGVGSGPKAGQGRGAVCDNCGLSETGEGTDASGVVGAEHITDVFVVEATALEGRGTACLWGLHFRH